MKLHQNLNTNVLQFITDAASLSFFRKKISEPLIFKKWIFFYRHGFMFEEKWQKWKRIIFYKKKIYKKNNTIWNSDDKIQTHKQFFFKERQFDKTKHVQFFGLSPFFRATKHNASGDYCEWDNMWTWCVMGLFGVLVVIWEWWAWSVV